MDRVSCGFVVLINYGMRLEGDYLRGVTAQAMSGKIRWDEGRYRKK